MNKEFLEELVPVRLAALKKVHTPEAAKTLRLLNWIFDISVEQYGLTNPRSYWLVKDDNDRWHFTDGSAGPGGEEKNHDDFPYIEGDLTLTISPSELSTLIPQYTYPQRRLTHMFIYRGPRGNRKDHFIEAEFEEGVRYKYRDTYRERDTAYETIVVRYNPQTDEKTLKLIRKTAADYAASLVGEPYSFSGKEGKFCTYLAGESYLHALTNYKGFVRKIGFAELGELFGDIGTSPLRTGLSRKYAAKFGVPEDEPGKPPVHLPSAGDFLVAKNFEPVAVFVNPKKARVFSDFYSIAEATVDALDRGSEIKLSPLELQKVEPLFKGREELKAIIAMIRKLKRHTLIRDVLKAEEISLESIDTMSVEHFKAILEKLREEKSALVEVTEEEIGLMTSVERNVKGFLSFGYADSESVFGETENLRNLEDKDPKNDHETISARDFFLGLKEKGDTNFDETDFKQLKLFIQKLNFNSIKKLIHYGKSNSYEARLPGLGGIVRAVDTKLKEGAMSDVELHELTDYVQTYALFLLAVPNLQKKVDEFKKDSETLKDILKQSPYIASSLSNQTLTEFGTYNKIASTAVEKYEEARKKMKTEYLWQTPPWSQRAWMDLILSKVKVMSYKP
jgi:hypothetical protein